MPARLTHHSLPARVMLGLLLAGLAVADTARFLSAMNKREPTLKRWLAQSAEFGQSTDFYDRHTDYLYPPAFLTLLRPLTWLPRPAAAVAWQLGKYAAIGYIFSRLWRMVGKPRPQPPWVLAAAIVMSLRFVVSDLAHGNVNLFIAAMLVAALVALQERRDLAAGLWVAVAACIKVTPALFALYLVGQRRWRAAAGFAIGCLLMLELVPLALVPPRKNHHLLARWNQRVVGDFLRGGRIYSPAINQSLAAITNRLFGRSELAPGEKPVTLVELSDPALKWLQRGLAAIILLSLALALRRPPGSPLALLLHGGLLTTAMLLLSGYTWSSHLVLLIPAHFALPAFLVSARSRFGSPEAAVAALTGVGFALCSLTGELLGRTGRVWALSIGLLGAGVLVNYAALWFACYRTRGIGR